MSNRSIEVRKAAKDDIPAIVAIHKDVVAKINSRAYPQGVIKEWLAEISEENVRKQFSESAWVVVEHGRRLVGFGQYSVGKGEVHQINVLPDFERRRYGRAIYRYIERDLVEHNISKIRLNSTLNAVGFYEKLGFQVVGETSFELDSEIVRMVIMVKQLTRGRKRVVS